MSINQNQKSVGVGGVHAQHVPLKDPKPRILDLCGVGSTHCVGGLPLPSGSNLGRGWSWPGAHFYTVCVAMFCFQKMVSTGAWENLLGTPLAVRPTWRQLPFSFTENGSQLLWQHHGAATPGAWVLSGWLLWQEVSFLPSGESIQVVKRTYIIFYT